MFVLAQGYGISRSQFCWRILKTLLTRSNWSLLSHSSLSNKQPNIRASIRIRWTILQIHLSDGSIIYLLSGTKNDFTVLYSANPLSGSNYRLTHLILDFHRIQKTNYTYIRIQWNILRITGFNQNWFNVTIIILVDH